MKHLERILVILSLTFFTLATAAFGAELKEVVAALEQGYNSLSDVQADFTQRTVITSMKREEHAKGALFIKKGSGNTSMFRFDYKKPRQLIVSDGRKAWYYLPDNNQVMVSDLAALFAGGNGIALNYLTGMGRISRDFSISFAGAGRDKKGNYLLELIPKEPSQAIAKLRLTVAASVLERYLGKGETGPIFPVLSSVVDDHFGNRTFIDLSRIRVNEGITDSRFRFKMPKGVEVIHNP
jgi:outer membrane lipoprotein carrier protein